MPSSSPSLCLCMQLSGAEKPPAGEPENNSSSAAAAGPEAPADGGSKVRETGQHLFNGLKNFCLIESLSLFIVWPMSVFMVGTVHVFLCSSLMLQLSD